MQGTTISNEVEVRGGLGNHIQSPTARCHAKYANTRHKWNPFDSFGQPVMLRL